MKVELMLSFSLIFSTVTTLLHALSTEIDYEEKIDNANIRNDYNEIISSQKKYMMNNNSSLNKVN